MRKTFYEILADKRINVFNEYDRLLYLAGSEQRVFTMGHFVTLFSYIDENYFRELSFRGTATSIYELISEIGLPEKTNQLDDLFLLCELLLAILPVEKTSMDSDLCKQTNTIRGNILHILERTNHELRTNKDGNPIVVSKNPTAILAAEIVDDDNVSFDLIEYNHYSLKGNLSEKKKILTSIGLYIEPILNNRTFKESMYKQLLSDAGFVFNNFHIRHNNLSGAKAQEYVVNLKDDELEKWYDKAYDLAIAVIVSTECLPVQNELVELKRNYNWKT